MGEIQHSFVSLSRVQLSRSCVPGLATLMASALLLSSPVIAQTAEPAPRGTSTEPPPRRENR